MALYQRGSIGPEVSKIQTRLRELGLYLGPIDGVFGGGTEVAVRAFQQANALVVDGRVGPQTWAALFAGAEIEKPLIANKPLEFRCMALTGAFETNRPFPDCFAPQVLQGIFDRDYPVLQAMLRASREEQLAWARSIQDLRRFVLLEPWQGQFKALGRRQEFQDIQVKFGTALYEQALALCDTYGVSSGRAAALMFDIKVQNGSISDLVRAQIERDFKQLDAPGDADPGGLKEVARLRIIANRRAEAANPRWVEDVRTRKLTIANGEGTVHGNYYNLEEQYGIALSPTAVLA